MLTTHPGSTKMHWDLKSHFWWSGMKRDITDFVARCLTYQKVKAEHQKPKGLLQPLPILVWKWDHITTFNAEQLADLYIREIVRLHGIPLSIISDRDTKFASRFWQGFQTAMGTEVHPSTAFHPQTDGQS